MKRIAAALGDNEGGDAADAVGALIASLGLPTRLRDVGVRQDQLGQVAAGAMNNLWVRTNPRPIEEQADIAAMLEAAW